VTPVVLLSVICWGEPDPWLPRPHDDDGRASEEDGCAFANMQYIIAIWFGLLRSVLVESSRFYPDPNLLIQDDQ
jgi:hypothetical protein